MPVYVGQQRIVSPLFDRGQGESAEDCSPLFDRGHGCDDDNNHSPGGGMTLVSFADTDKYWYIFLCPP